MGRVADADPGLADDLSRRVFRAGVGAVVKHRVVDDLAAMDARIGDAPTGAGHHHVVGDGKVGPVAVEGVDPLHIEREFEVRIRLPDAAVALDDDIRVGGIGNALGVLRRGRSVDRPKETLHAVRVVAVADIQVVVDVIVADDEIVRAVIEAVVAEMVDLVVRENGVVREQAYGVAGPVDFAAGEGNALGFDPVRAAHRRKAAIVRLGDPVGLRPVVHVFRRADEHGLENDVGSCERSLIADKDQPALLGLRQALDRDMLKAPHVGRPIASGLRTPGSGRARRRS